VAGTLNLGQPQYGNPYGRGGYIPPPPPPPPPYGAEGVAGTEAGQGARLGDYYVYPLPRPTTIEQNQTKQVGFVDAKGVAGERVYTYRSTAFGSAPRPVGVDTAIKFSNSRQGGLGSQLPAGTLRVYMRDTSGAARFVGENTIGHTPAGSELLATIGQAFDVTVQPTLVNQTRLANGVRQSMRYEFRNARREPVTVQFRQGTYATETVLVEESQPGRRIDNQTFGWDVRVPANGSASLTFTVDSNTR
jgi:hypothetical protein